MKNEYDPVSGEEKVVQKRKKRKSDSYFDYSLLFVWIFISAICSDVSPNKTRHFIFPSNSFAQSSNETFLSYPPAINTVGLDIA